MPGAKRKQPQAPAAVLTQDSQSGNKSAGGRKKQQQLDEGQQTMMDVFKIKKNPAVQKQQPEPIVPPTAAESPDEDDLIQPEEEEGETLVQEEQPEEVEPETKLRKKNEDKTVSDAKKSAKGSAKKKPDTPQSENAESTTGGPGGNDEETKAGEEEEEEEEEQEQEEEEEEEEEEGPGDSNQPKQVKAKVKVDHNAPKKPMNDKEAETGIAEFMERQNRPYSVQNILDHFQQRIKKAQCQRIMDDLTGQQILTCKEYGKAKIYLVNQDLFQVTTQDELAALDDQIKDRKDTYDALVVDLKSVQSKYKDASGGMTNNEVEAEIASLKKEISSIQKQLEPFKTGGRKLITQSEINKAEANLKKYQLEWKRRKRGCMEVIDQVSESVDMNRKDFIKKLGIETDEEYKVVCPL